MITGPAIELSQKGTIMIGLKAIGAPNTSCLLYTSFRKESGFAVMPALYGFRFLEESYGVAATPDGRHYGDPIAEHYCATPGRAVNGPTALLNSIAKAKEEISMAVGVCAVQITLPRCV